MENSLPPIPAKRYFTISEVGDLCGVKPHVLRYWEQEFTQLRPMKRSGNRRYYQHNEVLMIRRIRELLYDQGFTIHGARNQMQEMGHAHRGQKHTTEVPEFENRINGQSNGQSSGQLNGQLNGQTNGGGNGLDHSDSGIHDDALEAALLAAITPTSTTSSHFKWQFVRQELHEIRELLGASPQALRL
jgi:DNA-binding transcriptional MerR regulator